VSTPAQFLGQVGRFGPTLEANIRLALGAAAKVTQESVLDAARREGWPISGSGLGPIKVKATPPTHREVMVYGASSAAYAFEQGADPHPIAPRGATAGARARRNAARRGDRLAQVLGNRESAFGPVAYVARHPGFKGRPYWDKGVTSANPRVGVAMGLAVKDAVARTFR
jgi:hypothetical protein